MKNEKVGRSSRDASFDVSDILYTAELTFYLKDGAGEIIDRARYGVGFSHNEVYKEYGGLIKKYFKEMVLKLCDKAEEAQEDVIDKWLGIEKTGEDGEAVGSKQSEK